MLNGISFDLHPSNLFMCLLAIYTFLCRNAYANSLPIILSGFLFLFLFIYFFFFGHRSSEYFLDINPHQVNYLEIFSPSWGK